MKAADDRSCIKHRDLITLGRRFLPNANLRLGWSSSTKNMKKARRSVTKCMTLRLLYTSSLTGLLTGFFSHCMKRADAVLNQVCSLAINYHKAETNVEVSCQAAYSLEQSFTIIMSTLRTC
ncbi:hypothetical protein T08_12834 [Trichinella sp. T8]|nr:hypothetical protein T08_12834 [Trichinella sp. T8]